MTDLIPAPRTRSGVRYVFPHRSGKWRGAFKWQNKWYGAAGLFDTKREAFTAVVEMRARLRAGTESCTQKP